jgi:uncharacterized protein with PQ loop repeat
MKELYGYVAVILTVAAYIPYYRDILRGKTHPHVYSWSLWAVLTAILAGLQLQGGAGTAAWVTVVVGILCVGVVGLSLRKGKRDITTTDSVVASLALVAIVFWLLADKPLVSMVLAITADMLAFIPTVRKTYHKPYSETLSMYVTNVIRFMLAFAAIETYTFLSAAWIITWVTANALFSAMLIVRRAQVGFLPE